MEKLEKFPMAAAAPSRTRSLSRARRTRRTTITMFLLGLGSLSLLLLHIRPLDCLQHARGPWQSSPPPPSPPAHSDQSNLVAVEAHIMSKCPDARDCLRNLVLPVMEQVHDKVNFTLSFIGSPAGDSGVACKHGPAECLGNIIELCAAHLYPDPKTYLGFTMCLSNDYQEIPDRALIEQCALEHAIELKALNDCATSDNGAFGEDILRHSVQRTIDAGVTKSCTVRVDEKVWCIRDGGEWYDCPNGPDVDTLVTEIEDLHRSRSHDRH